MGHIVKTTAGTYRANWRDATGRQKAKTFKTKKEAAAFLAETETAVNRGTYVDPHAGRVRFGDFAERWVASRKLGARSDERTASVLRTHVLPKWGRWPLTKIDHLSVQEWVTELGQTLAPATVAKCYSLTSAILRAAIRSRLIAVDPSHGVTTPSTYRARPEFTTLTQAHFLGRLLPAVPAEHRALVCAAAGAGLRWGECAGLAWGAVDLSRDILRVVQVAEETSRGVRLRSYPKTASGVRVVPMAPFLVAELRARLGEQDREPDRCALVSATRTGCALRRSNFRRQVWRPALVRAGLLGRVVATAENVWRGSWRDAEGIEQVREFASERDAVAHVAENAPGGLRFHDLRHSYATWLVSAGVPVNVVQKVMGHAQASTTLNFYTHAPDDYVRHIEAAFKFDTEVLGETDDGAPPGERKALGR